LYEKHELGEKMMKTTCPSCQQQYEVDPSFNNQEVNCEKCGNGFIVTEFAENKNNGETQKKQTIKEPAAKDKYNTPILTQIFRYFAYVSLLGVAVPTILLLNGLNSRSLSPMQIIIILVSFFSTIFVCLFWLGFSELVDYIAKTAYYTEKSYKERNPVG
jgi:predicted Zn finger-like uncharacterized protein